jgi:uncharacterized protein GlcG (DUF336 family)
VDGWRHTIVTMNAKALALAGTAALLGGCSAVSGTPAIPGSRAASAEGVARQRTLVTFVIKVPRRVRRPHYVSPSTKSISIAIDAGTAQQKTVASNLAVGVTDVALELPVGSHTFNVATYDGALSGGVPTGHLLSAENGLSFTVVRGKANVVGATLQGVPSAIVVTPAQNQDVTGDQVNGFAFVGKYKADGTTVFPRAFTIATQDIDGNYIVGAGAPQIAAVSANSAVVSDGVAGGATSFTFTPGGNANFPASATVTITATPGAGAGAAIHAAVSMSVTCATAPRIYVWNGSKMLAYDESGNPVTLGGTAFSTLSGATAMAYDSNDNLLYVADGSSIYGYDLSGNKKYTGGASSGNFMTALGYGDGLLYGAGFAIPPSGGVTAFTESLAEQTTSGNWHETGSGAVPQLPVSLVVDAGGKVDILDRAAASPVVQQYSSQGTATSVAWFPTNTGTLAAMVQDPVTGYFYVSDTTTTVQVFDSTGHPVAVSGAFSGLSQAAGLGWDTTSRLLYVYDQQLEKMFAFDGQGDAVSLSGSFSGAYPISSFAVAL